MFWPVSPIDISSPCDTDSWRPLAVLLLWFLVFTLLFWLIYVSVKPEFVLTSDDQVDGWAALLAAAITALIVEVVVLLIKFAISYRR
jgi:hypothetical protein